MSSRHRTLLVLGAAFLAATFGAVVFHVLGERSKDAAVDGCIAAVRGASRATDVRARTVTVARACSGIYSERACRDGYLLAAADETDPAAFARIIRERCRDAYCPLLATPKPKLCDAGELGVAAASAAWPELVQSALVRDLGPERATRVLSEMATAARRVEEQAPRDH